MAGMLKNKLPTKDAAINSKASFVFPPDFFISQAQKNIRKKASNIK